LLIVSVLIYISLKFKKFVKMILEVVRYCVKVNRMVLPKRESTNLRFRRKVNLAQKRKVYFRRELAIALNNSHITQ